MKNNKFRKLLATVFTDLNAYFGENIGDYVDGYKINYSIRSNPLEENARTYNLNIDIWSKDDVSIDTITDNVEALLTNKCLYNDSWCRFVEENRYNADESNLFRRTLVYSVETYEEE